MNEHTYKLWATLNEAARRRGRSGWFPFTAGPSQIPHIPNIPAFIEAAVWEVDRICSRATLRNYVAEVLLRARSSRSPLHNFFYWDFDDSISRTRRHSAAVHLIHRSHLILGKAAVKWDEISTWERHLPRGGF